MTSRQITRIAALLGATTLAALGGAGVASADVSVTPADPAPGNITVLDFAVSDVRSDSPTTKVEITLPAGQSFTTMAARPKIGWDTTLVRPGGATAGPISAVLWTLTDDRFGIAPGAFDVFSLQLGPLPAAGRLVFPTVATYQNQAVDTWAPQVDIAAAPATAPAPAAAEEPKPDNQSRVTVGLAIGGAAILLAILGTAVGRRKPGVESDPHGPAR